MSGVLLGALPLAAVAQAPLSVDTVTDQASIPQIGGIAAMDIITLKASGPGAPLRYGNVVAGSERVQLDGERLTAGSDYAMDYAAGVVYLHRAQKAGQTLTVSYRYLKNADPKQISPFAGISGFKFDLVPGGLHVLMGLGMAERATDGSVLQSNAFGFNNSFKFGQSQLNGLYVYGNRQKTDNRAGIAYDMSGSAGSASTDDGRSQLLLQNYSSKMMGGTAQLDYQDISKNFASFGAVRDAGYDDGAVQRLQNERGLQRIGVTLKDMKIGSLGVSQSYRTVKDGNSSIDWRSFGVAQGGLKVNWNSQKVENTFTRFANLSEGNHDQLGREVGMSRQNLSGEFAQKVGKISFTSTSIRDDATGHDIHRKEWALDASNLKFNVGQQDVDAGFANRFPSLMGNEQAMYGREAGLHREWMSLNTAILGKATPFTFSQNILASDAGSFKARDASLKGSTWTLVHSDRKADATFGNLGSMTDGEVDSHVKAIAAMYGPGTPFGAGDRGMFMSGVGISRSYTGLTAQPFKKWNLTFDQLDLKGRQGKGNVTSASLTGKNSQFSYRHQALGQKFTEVTSLMGFEQAKLGTISGLDRTDMGMNLKFGGKTLTASRMTADSPTGGASRNSLAFQDKKIDVQVNTREVAAGFTNATQLVDAQSSLLNALVGFKERDAKVKWAILPTLNLDAALEETVNMQTNQANRLNQYALDWTPNGTTKVQYYKFNQENHDPLSTLFASEIERMNLIKNFGKYGVLTVSEETQNFDSAQTNLTDFHRQSFSYETKLDARTSIRTEQSFTKFEGGGKEDISANTISTTLTKRIGVSLTDMKVDRQGTEQVVQQNVAHRNYGFWYDFGHGLLLSYGYARQLTADGQGTMSSTLTVGQKKDGVAPDQVGSVGTASVGGVAFGGGYGVNGWDSGDRTQSFSNVSFASAKPLKFGVVKDLKFNFALDTAADYSQWLRENRVMGFSAKVGGNAFSFDYRGQMAQSGQRAIDRTYKLDTDASDKQKLKASIYYKLRTLPTDEQVMIRNFAITARPAKNLEVTQLMQTNPEVFQANALLGSVTQASRSNTWKVDYKRSPNLTFGASWTELINEQNLTAARTTGLNMKLFEAKGSPVTLFYGVEQSSQPTLRQLTERYSIQFDQRPGTNQILSFFVGNVSYGHMVPTGYTTHNWTLRLDYQLRFRM